MQLLYWWGGFRPVTVPKGGRRQLGKWSLKGPLGESLEIKGMSFISPTTRSEERRGNRVDESIPQIS
ncbi:hypothetical protein AVEN_157366-1, partial [Araneus ventricosus]